MKLAEGEVREKDNRFYGVADLASARNFNNKWEKGVPKKREVTWKRVDTYIKYILS